MSNHATYAEGFKLAVETPPVHPDKMNHISDEMYICQMEWYIIANPGADDFARRDLYDKYILRKASNKSRKAGIYNRSKGMNRLV